MNKELPASNSAPGRKPWEEVGMASLSATCMAAAQRSHLMTADAQQPAMVQSTWHTFSDICLRFPKHGAGHTGCRILSSGCGPALPPHDLVSHLPKRCLSTPFLFLCKGICKRYSSVVPIDSPALLFLSPHPGHLFQKLYASVFRNEYCNTLT